MYSYKRSSQAFYEACKVLPGGVNSPVRSFKSVGGTPIFMASAKGSKLYDLDGNEFIDYINSWGPMILGHAFEPVLEAIRLSAVEGTSFGAPTLLETRIAAKLIDMVPGIDQVRFVNSGTEACMSAIRLARGYTKREKIIKFAGCYHGHSDSFLIQAGSGAASFGLPDSSGVTRGTAMDTILATYNSLEEVEHIFLEFGNILAAIIIEPVAGNMGCIPPKKGFLEGLRKLCDEHGALLIFDEVMTGFRLARGGAQEFLSIKADIITFGKVIGGGLPVGAFAARSEIMDHLAPIGSVYQAGTLSGNPLAMAAGLAMLETIDTHPGIFEELNTITKNLAEELHEIFSEASIEHTINQAGSMMSVHFGSEKVCDFTSAKKSASTGMFNKFFHGMLGRGIYLPPSAYESWFISAALNKDDIVHTLEMAQETVKSITA